MLKRGKSTVRCGPPDLFQIRAKEKKNGLFLVWLASLCFLSSVAVAIVRRVKLWTYLRGLFGLFNVLLFVRVFLIFYWEKTDNYVSRSKSNLIGWSGPWVFCWFNDRSQPMVSGHVLPRAQYTLKSGLTYKSHLCRPRIQHNGHSAKP